MIALALYGLRLDQPTEEHGSLDRQKVVEQMARAAWHATGESPSWRKVPKAVRDEWINYQEAALLALEEEVPQVRPLFIE